MSLSVCYRLRPVLLRVLFRVRVVEQRLTFLLFLHGFFTVGAFVAGRAGRDGGEAYRSMREDSDNNPFHGIVRHYLLSAPIIQLLFNQRFLPGRRSFLYAESGLAQVFH